MWLSNHPSRTFLIPEHWPDEQKSVFLISSANPLLSCLILKCDTSRQQSIRLTVLKAWLSKRYYILWICGNINSNNTKKNEKEKREIRFFRKALLQFRQLLCQDIWKGNSIIPYLDLKEKQSFFIPDLTLSENSIQLKHG